MPGLVVILFCFFALRFEVAQVMLCIVLVLAHVNVRVWVMSTYTLRYSCGAGMFLHDELLEAWSGGYFVFCF